MKAKSLGNSNKKSSSQFKTLALAAMLGLGGGATGLYFYNKSPSSSATEAAANSANLYSENLFAQMSKLGQVSNVQPMAGELLAWTMLINGQPQVVFTTKDEKVVITGNAFDTATMDSVSLPILQSAQKGGVPANSTGAPAPANGNVSVDFAEIVGKWDKEVPPSIALLDKLKGAKEGNASAVDTLYVVFDPQCSNCHNAYRATREYVKKGFSIKWIPATLIGDKEVKEYGAKLAAAVLRDPKQLEKAFSKDPNIVVDPTPEEKSALEYNLQFLTDATFQSTGSHTIAVPTAFYLNKKTGEAKMTTGLSDESILDMIFGKI